MNEITETLKFAGILYFIPFWSSYWWKLGDKIGNPEDYKSREAKIYLALPFPFDALYASKRWHHVHPITLENQEPL